MAAAKPSTDVEARRSRTTVLTNPRAGASSVSRPSSSDGRSGTCSESSVAAGIEVSIPSTSGSTCSTVSRCGSSGSLSRLSSETARLRQPCSAPARTAPTAWSMTTGARARGAARDPTRHAGEQLPFPNYHLLDEGEAPDQLLVARADDVGRLRVRVGAALSTQKELPDIGAAQRQNTSRTSLCVPPTGVGQDAFENAS